MRINQNIMAFNAFRNLSKTNNQLGGSLEKLSSGFRINRAADDAAGLVVSEGLRAQVSGLRVATRNAQDGVSVVQTAEGALQEVHTMLRRMRDLALGASNTGASDQASRDAAQAEIAELRDEINRIAEQTKFGQTELLDGSYGVTNASASVTSAGDVVLVNTDDFTFQAGADVGDQVTVNVSTTRTYDPTVTADADALATALQSDIRDALALDEQYDRAAALTVSVTSDGTNFDVQVDLGTGEDFTIADGAGTPIADNFAALADTFVSTGDGGLFQVGANAEEVINIAISSIKAAELGVTGDLANGLNDIDVAGTDEQREFALESLDVAIAEVSDQRGVLGAAQNRFEHTIANLSVTSENLAASESRIRDTDMALELVSFTRHQILQQAGTAMLAQANQVPASVLGLL